MNDTINDHPVISIVTPSYNQGEFLAETIESVISQEGDFLIDFIIVDGGSSDNSLDIIKHYDELLQIGEWPVKCLGIEYHWMSEKDKGQTDALMKGFRIAKGDVYAWLNSDDTYLPGALQTAAGFFRNNPKVGLMYGNAHYCDRTGRIIGDYRTAPFDLETLAYANIICQPSTFFRREVFESVNGLNGALHYVMDYDLWIRIGRLFPCRHVPHLLATYRLHDTSKTVCSDTLYLNCEESLIVTIRHFGWAPLTRIYTSCSILCKDRLPSLLGQYKFLVAASAIACSIIRSLYLNRGFNRKDLKLLKAENFAKLFKNRLEIMTGQRNLNHKKKS
jgi:glycosyltransferase involved in cell wall biosynthesis